MEKNLLNRHVADLLKSIERNLAFYSKNSHPESLHLIRLDIKKIKSIFSFAEEVYKKKYNTNKLKPLFKKAGRIREIHIYLHLLVLLPHPHLKIIEQLKCKDNVLRLKFVNRASRYLWLINNFRDYCSLPENLPNKRIIIKYFRKEQKEVNSIIKGEDREGFHLYRARIKKLMYAYSALPDSIQQEIELNVGEINKRQKLLGNWHDIYSAVQFLSGKYFSDKTNKLFVGLKEKEKRLFKKLRRNISNNRF
jgi:CHAD domain-containing protein